MDGLSFGTNIAHWISQCKLDRNVMAEWFTPNDVERIASFGMDHFRLPVDYRLFELDEKPFAYMDEGLSWIDRALEWAERAGLRVVLDMHFLPGHHFLQQGDNTIWQKGGEGRARSVAIWEDLAERYRGAGHVVLELLNEPVAVDDEDWNDLAAELLAAVRRRDPEAWVMIPSNCWDHLLKFKTLRHFDDSRVVYTFHSYDPQLFTHQNAGWAPVANELGGRQVPYPGPLDAEILITQSLKEKFGWMALRSYGRGYLEENLQAALDFNAGHGVPLYCGEFGVLSRAPRVDLLRWYGDICSLYRGHGIGMANWNYKGRGFGLVGEGGRVDEELLLILRGDG